MAWHHVPDVSPVLRLPDNPADVGGACLFCAGCRDEDGNVNNGTMAIWIIGRILRSMGGWK